MEWKLDYKATLTILFGWWAPTRVFYASLEEKNKYKNLLTGTPQEMYQTLKSRNFVLVSIFFGLIMLNMSIDPSKVMTYTGLYKIGDKAS